MHGKTASQLERLDRCPASLSLPGFRETSPWAESGREKHAVMKRVVDICGEGVPVGQAVAAALVDVEDGEIIELMENMPWEQLPVGAGYAAEVAFALDVFSGKARELARGVETREEAYADLQSTELGGISDIVALASDHVLVTDWKFGWSERKPAKQSHQLKTLALMACLTYGVPRAKVSLIRAAAPGKIWSSSAELDAFALGAWHRHLHRLNERLVAEAAHVASGAAKVNAGPWCRWCPATASCPAQVGTLRALVSGELERRIDSLMPFTPESFAEAWKKIELLEQITHRVKSKAMAYAKYNGPIDLGDGRFISEAIVESYERWNGKVAYEVVAELRGEGAAVEMMRTATKEIPKSRIQEAIKSSMVDGEKFAPIEREVLGEIRRRGGSRKPTSARIAVQEFSDGE